MSLFGAVRRLLKSRLRLHIFTKLAAERPSESWATVIEVEKGISEDAWSDWEKIRAGHPTEDIDQVAQDALAQAVVSAKDAFKSITDEQWLKEQIAAFQGPELTGAG